MAELIDTRAHGVALTLDEDELNALRAFVRVNRDPESWDVDQCPRHPLCRVAEALGVVREQPGR